MQKATKICRVCGAEYKACHTQANLDGAFRWQDVACSPECGAIYLARVNAARGITPESERAPEADTAPVAAEPAQKRTRKKKTEQ